MKFTVERSSWDRGHKNGSLLSENGLCCLGFLGRACGLGDGDLRGQGLPEETIQDSNPGWPESLVYFDDEKGQYCDRRVVSDIVDVNDDDSLDEDFRESKLQGMFHKLGIQVEFVP